MKLRSFCLLSLTLSSGLCTAAPTSDQDVRFSRTLPPAELSASGLTKISSDQIAVLDALVRRDVANSQFVSKKPRPAHFSQRLTADERRNAGLDQLDESEIGRLDVAVQRLISPPPAGTFSLAAPSGGYSVPSVKLRREPEIHGSLELMFGVGSHGYSEYGGAMTLTYDDPANRYSIAVSYAELHTKGGYLYRDCHDGFDRWPRALRN